MLCPLSKTDENGELTAVATKFENGSALKSGSLKNCSETFASFSPMRVPPPFLEKTD